MTPDIRAWRPLISSIHPLIQRPAHLRSSRAVLPNTKDEMRPGQFVRVRIPLGEPRKALLFPQFFLAGRREPVFVVNEKNILEERTVEIGDNFDGGREIVSGLKVGDRVLDTSNENSTGLKAGDEVEAQGRQGCEAELTRPATSIMATVRASGIVLTETEQQNRTRLTRRWPSHYKQNTRNRDGLPGAHGSGEFTVQGKVIA